MIRGGRIYFNSYKPNCVAHEVAKVRSRFINRSQFAVSIIIYEYNFIFTFKLMSSNAFRTRLISS